MSDPDFPFLLFEYGANGMHNGSVRIENDAELESAMRGPISRAVAEGREVRITDTGDFLVFHAENGRIIWPTREACDAVIPPRAERTDHESD